MNYYERHLGDYAKDTAHLSMLEHGAYTLLLDRYYATEQGIEIGHEYRIARARGKVERAAVDAVLKEFFFIAENFWVKRRVQEEIARSMTKIVAARENGRKGGRPRVAVTNHQEPTGLIPVTENVTQLEPKRKLSSLQSPVTIEKETEKREARKRAPPLACPDDVDEKVWADWLQLRRGKNAAVSTTVLDGARSECVKAGMSLEAFLRVWCVRGSQGLQAEWLRPNERHNDASGETAWQRSQRLRVAEMTGGLASSKPPGQRQQNNIVEVFDGIARLVG